MKRALISLLTLLFLAPVVQAKTYTIDDSHSSVTFSIRHLVGRVAGHFDKFSGNFDYEPGNPKAWKTEATIDAASINTGNTKRDEHLRTADFFDTAKYPTLTFKSTKVTESKENSAKVEGYLTMHGVTKPVVLNLEFTGVMKDPWGKERAGVTATTKVNRKDFGIVYNKALDAGGMMLGDDVDIVINIEGVAK